MSKSFYPYGILMKKINNKGILQGKTFPFYTMIVVPTWTVFDVTKRTHVFFVVRDIECGFLSKYTFLSKEGEYEL
jgi:hypothetical protein